MKELGSGEAVVCRPTYNHLKAPCVLIFLGGRFISDSRKQRRNKEDKNKHMGNKKRIIVQVSKTQRGKNKEDEQEISWLCFRAT